MILLKGGTVWRSGVWTETNVLVKGDRIAAIGDPEAERDALASGGIDILECAGKLVIPGLINAHSHSYTGLLKGTVDTVPLDIYMLYAIAGGSERSERAIYLSTKIDALQMVRNGITSVVDHFSQRPRQEVPGIAAAVKAYRETGVRVRIAPMFSDRSYFETVPLLPGELPDELKGPPPENSQTPREYLEVCERCVRDLQDDRMVRFTIGTDGPQRCSPELLDGTADLEGRLKIGWHTHLLESKSQAITSRDFFGRTLVDHLDSLGMINERTVLVHAVWLTPLDIDIVRARNATIVHCPNSNIHLGSGIAPVAAYRAAGVPVAVATDGGNTGSLSLLDNLRSAARLSRIASGATDEWLSADDVLQMGYDGGARAMGLERQVGAIEPGAFADIVVVSRDAEYWHPPYDPATQLVYYANSSDVDSVIVNGDVVLRSGTLSGCDEHDLRGELADIAARLRRDNANRFERARAQERIFAGMYARVTAERVGISRLIESGGSQS